MTMDRMMTMREVRRNDEPISEKFRLVAIRWADADAAANLLEETKSTFLEELKTRIIGEHNGDISEAKAERLAKCMPEWRDHIDRMCKVRAEANKRRVQLEYLRMKHSEW